MSFVFGSTLPKAKIFVRSQRFSLFVLRLWLPKFQAKYSAFCFVLKVSLNLGHYPLLLGLKEKSLRDKSYTAKLPIQKVFKLGFGFSVRLKARFFSIFCFRLRPPNVKMQLRSFTAFYYATSIQIPRAIRTQIVLVDIYLVSTQTVKV